MLWRLLEIGLFLSPPMLSIVVHFGLTSIVTTITITLIVTIGICQESTILAGIVIVVVI
jgi:hypothetical protein